jgi:hypothetical protein
MGPVVVSDLLLIVEVMSAAELDRVVRMASAMGLELAPLHPGTGDPDLQRFLAASVPDFATGQEAAERLNSVAGVSAHVKPPAELA